MKNDIVTGLTEARINHILSLIAALKAELDFLIQLDKKERSAENGVAEGRLPFTQGASEVGQINGNEINLPADEQADLARMSFDHAGMIKILKQLKALLEGVSDTTLKIGANLYERCLIVRDLVEVAIRRGVPGMESVYEELSYLWENRQVKPSNDSEVGTDSEAPKP